MRRQARQSGDRRVLYVLKRFPRVSETFVLRELLALESLGIEIAIDSLLPPESQPRHPELAHLRADVRYVARRPRVRDGAVAAAHLSVALRAPVQWVRLATRARRAKGWRRFVQAGLVAQRARHLRVSNIHAHFVTAAAEVARDAAALAGVPFSVTAHAKDIYQRDNAPVLAERLEGAAAIVTISEFNVRHLREVLPRHRIVHVPNGMPLEALAPVPADGPLLCVARLIPKKGVDVLVEAFASIAPRFPATVLELIGEGPLAEELRASADRQGVRERTRFRGFVTSDAVGDALARCALLALPCRVAPDGDRDGIPMVLLEAMARGVPVISTPVSGIPEVVKDGETGLLVPPDDPSALAEAMARVLSDRELARALGAGGRSLIAERFDPDRSARSLAQLFEAQVGEPSPSRSSQSSSTAPVSGRRSSNSVLR